MNIKTEDIINNDLVYFIKNNNKKRVVELLSKLNKREIVLSLLFDDINIIKDFFPKKEFDILYNEYEYLNRNISLNNSEDNDIDVKLKIIEFTNPEILSLIDTLYIKIIENIENMIEYKEFLQLLNIKYK